MSVLAAAYSCFAVVSGLFGLVLECVRACGLMWLIIRSCVGTEGEREDVS